MHAKPYSRCKPSGVDWLGDVPEGWKVKRLKYSASINDEALPETTPSDFELKYVDIGGVDAVNGITTVEDMVFEDAPLRARRIVRDGDTIVSTVRTYLRAISPIRKPPDNLIVSTGFAVIHPRKIDADYLSYALRESGFVETVVARSVGVSYPAINASEVGTIPITLPPAAEQRAIADFLDRETKRIDALVEKKETLIERLKEKRTTFISRTVTRGLPPDAARAASLDPHPKLRPSGIDWLGDVLAHWKVERLGWHIDLLTGFPFQSERFSFTDGISLVRGDNVTEGSLRWGEKTRYWPEPTTGIKQYLLAAGDLLIGMDGSKVGKNYARVTEADLPLLLVQRVARLRVGNSLERRFLFRLIGSELFRSWVELTKTDPAIPHISPHDIRSYPIPLPCLDEQRAIADFLDRETAKFDRMLSKVETAVKRLQEYRTALITAAVTGKIDVRGQSADNGRVFASAS